MINEVCSIPKYVFVHSSRTIFVRDIQPLRKLPLTFECSIIFFKEKKVQQDSLSLLYIREFTQHPKVVHYFGNKVLFGLIITSSGEHWECIFHVSNPGV